MQALNLKQSVSELLPIVRKNPTAQSIVVYLAERARHRTDTDLKRLKYDMYHAGVFVDDREYEAFWEELAATGKVGRLLRATTIEEPVMKNGKPVKKDGKPVVNKIQKPAKFHWTFSCKIFGIEMRNGLIAAGVNPMNHANLSLARLEGKTGRKPRMQTEAAPANTKVDATTAVRITAGNAKLFAPYGISKSEAEAISKQLLKMAK